MRSVLFLPLFALAACAPWAEDGDEEHAPAPPFGFELARAQDGPAAPASAVIDLSPMELRARLGTVRLIDVRTDDEVAEGTIPGTEHVPLGEFDPGALDLSLDENVVLYCRSGRRSEKAAQMLSAESGQPARHLAGGILAWRKAGGALVTPD